MNIQQKSLVEKVIKIRYNGLIESLSRTKSLVESENEKIDWYLPDFDDHDLSDLPMEAMKNDFRLIHKTLGSLKKAISDENERRSHIRSNAKRKRTVLVDLLERERDNKIIEVAFEGEAKEVIGQLKKLPTAKNVVQRLGTLKLTGDLTDSSGLGGDTPSSLSSAQGKGRSRQD